MWIHQAKFRVALNLCQYIIPPEISHGILKTSSYSRSQCDNKRAHSENSDLFNMASAVAIRLLQRQLYLIGNYCRVGADYIELTTDHCINEIVSIYSMDS